MKNAFVIVTPLKKCLSSVATLLVSVEGSQEMFHPWGPHGWNTPMKLLEGLCWLTSTFCPEWSSGHMFSHYWKIWNKVVKKVVFCFFFPDEKLLPDPGWICKWLHVQISLPYHCTVLFLLLFLLGSLEVYLQSHLVSLLELCWKCCFEFKLADFKEPVR